MTTRQFTIEAGLQHQLRTEPYACPGCGKQMDGISGPRAPHHGDVSFCIFCGALMVLGEGLRPHLITPEEWLEFPAEQRTDLRVVEQMIRRFIASRQKEG